MEITSVLIVDDSKMARITLKKQLEARDITVYMSESGEESLEFLKTNEPDLIFMDCLMPGIDGFETTRQIMSNPDTSSIPVVMCTGKESDDDKQKAFDLGAVGYMTKSSSTEPLDAILDEIKRTETVTTSTTESAAPSISVDEVYKIAEQAANAVAESTLSAKINSEINELKAQTIQDLNLQLSELTEKLEEMVLFSVKSSFKDVHGYTDSEIERLKTEISNTITEATSNSTQTLQQEIDSLKAETSNSITEEMTNSIQSLQQEIGSLKAETTNSITEEMTNNFQSLQQEIDLIKVEPSNTISDETTTDIQDLQQKFDTLKAEITQIDITDQVQQEVQQQIKQDLQEKISSYASNLMEDELSRSYIDSLIQEKLSAEQLKLDEPENINETSNVSDNTSSGNTLSVVALLLGASAFVISVYQMLQ